MADMITGAVTGFVNNWPEQTSASLSDIRREAAEHTNEIVKEGLKGDYNTQGSIKDTRFDINSRLAGVEANVIRDVDRVGDNLMNQFFTVSRDTADLRAQIVAQQQQLVAGFATAAKDAEINALKTQIELSKQTTYLSDKIDDQNEKTRGLINDLRYHDLNRALVERNAELVEERCHGRHYKHWGEQSQWASLNSQLQAFQSQLQETRQGMVNFGTMAGVGQTSTSNNVR
jgi:hypothetical protein